MQFTFDVGDKRILSSPDTGRSQWEERPAARSELALVDGGLPDQNDRDANPCGSCTFVASFRRHIVRHSKGTGKRLLLCQRIFPTDKR